MRTSRCFLACLLTVGATSLLGTPTATAATATQEPCASAEGFRTCLEGSTWQFNAAGTTVPQLKDATDLTATLQDGQISIQLGCNDLFAAYTLNPEQRTITFTEFGTTMMLCEQPVMDHEQAVFEAFSDATWTAEPTLERLQLTGTDATISFIAKK